MKACENQAVKTLPAHGERGHAATPASNQPSVKCPQGRVGPQPAGWPPTFLLVGCGLVCRALLFEEFGHVIEDQVEVNGKYDGGKEAKHLWIQRTRWAGWESLVQETERYLPQPHRLCLSD